MKIFFIRHGESTGDIENLYGGSYDDHLSEKGKEQAKILAQELKSRNIEIIFSSPLLRAKEVAEIVAEEVGCRVIFDEDLRERNQYGILTGINKDIAKEKYPEQVELLKNRFNTIEGAESYEDFSKRIIGSFNKIANNPEHKTIAIVSHGGPMRVLFRDILKWGELVEIGDCSYAELEKKNNIFVPVHYERITLDFEIRRFKNEDKQAVHDLHIRALKHAEILIENQGLRNGFDKDLENIEETYLKNGEFLVATLGKEIVGMGAFRKVDETTAEIKRMRTKPELQGRGIGKLILDNLIERAKELGYKKLILDVAEKQKIAQHLYESRGFTIYKTGHLGGQETRWYHREIN